MIEYVDNPSSESVNEDDPFVRLVCEGNNEPFNARVLYFTGNVAPEER